MSRIYVEFKTLTPSKPLSHVGSVPKITRAEGTGGKEDLPNLLL